MTEQDLNVDPNHFNEWSHTTANVIEKLQGITNELVKRHKEQLPDLQPMEWHEWIQMGERYQDVLKQVWSRPDKFIQAQMGFWHDYVNLCQNTSLAMMGQAHEKVIEADPRDKRFKHEGWQESPVFDFIKQAYLLMGRHANTLVQHLEGMDRKTKQQIEFFTRQFIDAVAPSNFLFTNPEVLELTLNSHGANLVQGLDNFLEDLKRSKGPFNIKMTDLEAFEVGKNLALTPGDVVFESRLFQLIQYSPSTDKVHKTPVLVVPPSINKYYILDLRPDNSYVKWLVDQGHTVFMLSWANPDSSFGDVTFEDYVLQGIVEAMSAIEKVTGEKQLHAVSYCIGGTLLATALAYLSAKDLLKKRVRSATFFATMLDFSEPGELGVYIDEKQLKQLDLEMSRTGYLSGDSMAFAFNLLRDNDLIWSYFVNNYLRGKEPFPFDLLFWNCDATNLAANMHSFYLRQCYLHNNLCKPDGIKIGDVSIDLRLTYVGAGLFSGPVRFVLAGSGHIAGIVNPPTQVKYGYAINATLAETADYWLDSAKKHEGSWWPDWQQWLTGFADEMIAPRKVKKSIEPAPGRYVKKDRK